MCVLHGVNLLRIQMDRLLFIFQSRLPMKGVSEALAAKMEMNQPKSPNTLYWKFC